MTKLDKKLYVKDGQIFKVKDDTAVPEDEYVIFLAHDNAFAAVLENYRQNCLHLNCDREQIEAVDLLTKNVRDWRRANESRLKNPDAKGEKLAE